MKLTLILEDTDPATDELSDDVAARLEELARKLRSYGFGPLYSMADVLITDQRPD